MCSACRPLHPVLAPGVGSCMRSPEIADRPGNPSRTSELPGSMGRGWGQHPIVAAAEMHKSVTWQSPEGRELVQDLRVSAGLGPGLCR